MWESFACFHNSPNVSQTSKIQSHFCIKAKQENRSIFLKSQMRSAIFVQSKKKKKHIYARAHEYTQCAYIERHTLIAGASYGSVICQHIVCGVLSCLDNGATIPRDRIPKKWPLKHRVHSNGSPTCVNNSNTVTIRLVSASDGYTHTVSTQMHCHWKQHLRRLINRIGSLQMSTSTTVIFAVTALFH